MGERGLVISRWSFPDILTADGRGGWGSGTSPGNEGFRAKTPSAEFSLFVQSFRIDRQLRKIPPARAERNARPRAEEAGFSFLGT